ncbi:MAG: IS256 family transposase, partial [Calditrichaeota bacterium]
MAQVNITLNEELLKAVSSGEKGMKELMEAVLNQILDAQVTEHLEAGRYERSAGRKGYRNGYRKRVLHSRVGTLELQVPQTRNGQFSSALFQRYQRSERAFLLAMMEMVVQGVSTRKVRQVTEQMCGTGFSKSTVSRLCGQLDALVTAWNERPLTSRAYPFLLVDAMRVKVRHDHRVQSSSLLIVTGVNQEGYREILGFSIGDSESFDTWEALFRRLKERGLSGVYSVTSDNHQGLVQAIQKHFQGTLWNRCQVHFKKNVLDATPLRYRADMKDWLTRILDARSEQEAWALFHQCAKEMEGKTDRALRCLEDGLPDAMTLCDLPDRFRLRLRTTNMVERLNEEVRRRERVIRIFPNEQSVYRLIGAVLMETDEKWSTGRLYLNMELFQVWLNKQSS